MNTAIPVPRGIIFDMDGTLTVPVLDFAAMRARLGIPSGDILATVRSWTPEQQTHAYAIIDELEEQGRCDMALQPGARDLVAWLEGQGIEKAILTRNTVKTVDHLLQRLPFRFSVVVTRDFEFVKPDPAPVLHICARWVLPPEAVMVVGDYRDDIVCGRAAGARTCLLRNAKSAQFAELADEVVDSLGELHARLRTAS